MRRIKRNRSDPLHRKKWRRKLWRHNPYPQLLDQHLGRPSPKNLLIHKSIQSWNQSALTFPFFLHNLLPIFGYKNPKKWPQADSFFVIFEAVTLLLRAVIFHPFYTGLGLVIFVRPIFDFGLRLFWAEAIWDLEYYLESETCDIVALFLVLVSFYLSRSRLGRIILFWISEIILQSVFRHGFDYSESESSWFLFFDFFLHFTNCRSGCIFRVLISI